VHAPRWKRCFASRDARDVAAALTLLVALAGCTSDDPARAAAERFVDQYYVEIDLVGAHEEASGLARAKVEREMKLLEGVQPAEESSRPRVHYRFVEQQEPGRDRRGFVYELTISFDGGDQIQRRTLVTVGEADGAWHAVNFQEMD
jgi:hypothetical protein